MPKVSVIIPIYGVEKYIERCAESLFQQTLNDIEYIFVEDCTTDRSIDILNIIIDKYSFRFEEQKKYVKIIRMPSNSGLHAVRQAGIKLATGKYIVHCDSDDWVDTDMYRAMYEKAERDDADIVVCDFYIADVLGNNKAVKGCISKNCNSFFSDLLCQKISWAVWNKMVKRSVYTDSFIYPAGAMGEDMVICMQLLLYSKKLSYVNKPYYYYFENATSITKQQSKEATIRRFQQSVANGSIILKISKEWNLYKMYKNEIDSILLNKKNLIRPLIGEEKYYKIWKQTFSDLNFSIFWNKKVTFTSKVKHVLTFLKLYRRES